MAMLKLEGAGAACALVRPGTMSWKALNSSKQRETASRTGSMRRDKVMGRPHSFYQAAMNYMSDNDIQQNMRYEKSHTVGPPPNDCVENENPAWLQTIGATRGRPLDG